jgi:hypothetical protein
MILTLQATVSRMACARPCQARYPRQVGKQTALRDGQRAVQGKDSDRRSRRPSSQRPRVNSVSFGAVARRGCSP